MKEQRGGTVQVIGLPFRDKITVTDKVAEISKGKMYIKID
jgi:hypothetical protein